MRHVQTGSVILLAAAFCLTLPPGCKKDAPATTVKPAIAETVAEPPAAKKAPPRIRGSVDTSSATMLRYLPRDSSFVMGLNWQQARQHEFVRSFDDKFIDAIPELAGIQAKCGLDPLTAIHSVALALGPDPTITESGVMAISGAFTREEVENCVVAHGGIVEGDRYNGESNVYWPSPNVVVISTGHTSEQLALAPSASAWDNDKLMVLVDELDLHASFWAAGMVPPSLASSFGAMGKAPWGGYATADLGVGMRATLGLEFANEDEAKSMMTMFNTGLTMLKGQPPVGELLNHVTVGVVGQAVVVVGDFTADELVQMQMMLKQAGF